MPRKSFVVLPVLVSLLGLGLWTIQGGSHEAAKAAENGAADDENPAVDPAAVERTRDTVRMLDDIYKTTVVLITDKYVHDVTDFPAGSAAVALFEAIGEKGWHDVRLIDATGQPIEKKNVARDEFEKEAVRRLKDGKDFYEKVVRDEGKAYLRAATPVPVVMEKCVMCHSHYADAEKGEPIGAIVYRVPIR